MAMAGKPQRLAFSNGQQLRRWLEHGAGKKLLDELTAAKVEEATRKYEDEIAGQRLLTRQMVLIVLESNGQIRDVYATSNASVAIRAMIEHDEEAAMSAEEYLVRSLPRGFRDALTMADGLDGRKAARGIRWPILNQTAEAEQERLFKLELLQGLRELDKAIVRERQCSPRPA